MFDYFFAFTVKSFRVVRNAFIDLRHGKLLGGKIPSRYRHDGAVDTENSDYVAIARLCTGQIATDDVLVDVGCGKGRVIAWWIGQGLSNKIIGIELDPAIAIKTAQRFRSERNVEILAGDAVKLIPNNGTVFYMYNPFRKEKMIEFREKLKREVPDLKRVRIIYNNCKQLSVFTEDNNWVVKNIHIGGSKFLPFDKAAIITWNESAKAQAVAESSVSTKGGRRAGAISRKRTLETSE